MAENRRCGVCGETAAQGRWRLWVRLRWPFRAWVCSDCHVKRDALDSATRRAWSRGWLCAGAILYAMGLVFLLADEQIAGVLPLRLTAQPEPLVFELPENLTVPVTVDGVTYEYHVTAMEAGRPNESGSQNDQWNELYKGWLVGGVGIACAACALVILWRSHRAARRRAVCSLEERNSVSAREERAAQR